MSDTELKKPASIDEILDGTLDDLADIPEWKPFPAGGHKCIISFETGKSQKDVPQVKVKLVAVETVELANPASDTPLEKGAEAVIAYTFDNEYGQGGFKKLMAIFKEHLGLPDGTKNGEIMKASQNMECIAITTVGQNKDKTQKFTRIEDIAFE